MKKKELKLIKKEKFDNFTTGIILKKNFKKNTTNSLTKLKRSKVRVTLTRFQRRRKNKKRAMILYLKKYSQFKLIRGFFPKYSVVFKYWSFFQSLVRKKEFFFFKNFFLKFRVNSGVNLLLFPHFVFEKQFLFKFGEYQTFLFESVNSAFFLKKKYGFINNPGLNYWVNTDNSIENADPKEPVFYIKDFFQLRTTLNEINFVCFHYNVNFNIFFFVLIDIYKILLLLQLKNIFN